MAVFVAVRRSRLYGRVEALKAVCHMRLDRDDLRASVEDAATDSRRRRGADKEPAAASPATLDDFRCSPSHSPLLHDTKRLIPHAHLLLFCLFFSSDWYCGWWCAGVRPSVRTPLVENTGTMTSSTPQVNSCHHSMLQPGCWSSALSVS